MGEWPVEHFLTQDVIAVSDDQFILRLFRLLDNSEKQIRCEATRRRTAGRSSVYWWQGNAHSGRHFIARRDALFHIPKWGSSPFTADSAPTVAARPF